MAIQKEVTRSGDFFLYRYATIELYRYATIEWDYSHSIVAFGFGERS